MDHVWLVNSYWRGPRVAYRYRHDPVPGIHVRRGRSGFRHPKTLQEMRMTFADPEFVRPARRKPNLPTLWDDCYRSDITAKSWKTCTKKRKQWM